MLEISLIAITNPFFQIKVGNIATVRAGNCFWRRRLDKRQNCKDSLGSFSQNKKLILRSPEANRPWQHVIELLFGYLILAEKLSFKKKEKKICWRWEFWAKLKQNMKVLDLAKLIKQNFNSRSRIVIKRKDKRFHTKNLKYLNQNT